MSRPRLFACQIIGLLSFIKRKSQYMLNSVYPDQLASQKPADLDLHCFQNFFSEFRKTSVNRGNCGT